MHYNSNYEAFQQCGKPVNTDRKTAYLIGGGLASLAAAVFLIRDGKMKGDRIHIFEEFNWEDENLGGMENPFKSFVIRGGMEMDEHPECLRNLLSSIPSLEGEETSVWDQLSKPIEENPCLSRMRSISDRGNAVHIDPWFQLSDDHVHQLIKLFFTAEKELDDKRISDVLPDDFFNTRFWNFWRWMYALDEWHGATEMRRYLSRFIDQINKLPDLSVFRFTRYNPYKAIVLPLIEYLKSENVRFYEGTKGINVLVDNIPGKKVARKIVLEKGSTLEEIELDEDKLVFVANGSITDSSTYGDQHTPVLLDALPGGSWSLWRNMAVQDNAFGKPEKFCSNILETSIVSATLTVTDDLIPSFIERIAPYRFVGIENNPGEIIAIEDSNWSMSFTLINRPSSPQEQADYKVSVWIYGLLPYRLGNHVKKQMKDCTGAEIAEEWLYHLGVPQSDIHTIAANSAHTIPCLMPYALSCFVPRAVGDRPLVVPTGSVNLAFIGNFAETPREVVFTPEYAIRTAMEAVYRLLAIPHPIPEVSPACFDVRVWLRSLARLSDGRRIYNMELPFGYKYLSKKGIERSRGTIIHEMLEEYGLI